MNSTPTNHLNYGLTRLARTLCLVWAKSALLPSNQRVRLCRWGGVDIANLKGTFIGQDVLFDTLNPQKIHLKGRVNITSGCKLITHYYVHGFLDKGRHYEFGDIYIGDNVFLGMNVLIVKPVHIGNNVCIAAGSVVTQDIPDNEIWGGVPAHFIKRIELV